MTSFRDAARALASRVIGSRAPSAMTPGIGPEVAATPRALRELAMRALPALGPEPIVLAYWPLVRNNPFQQLLYARAWDEGIACIPVRSVATPEGLADVPASAWLHVHWTGSVLARARNRADAEKRMHAFVASLDDFLERDGRLAWSVHNVLPHEHVFADLEAAIGRSLAERAHLVHVLSADAPALMRPHFELPSDRILVIEHCSYEGVYPDIVGRTEARNRLGLPQDALVLATVGAIRRYKGIDVLLDALRQVPDEGLRALIAGPPVLYPDVRALRARCDADPRVVARFERIPEQDLQLYLNAADVAVLPYADVLNSSALMLAFTFGKPVIASRAGAVAGFAAQAGVLFEPGDSADLARALRDAATLRDPRFSEAARSFARSRPPRAMSEAFARSIKEMS